MSASAIGSAITITVVYYCITGERGSQKGVGAGMRWVERKPPDPKGKETGRAKASESIVYI
jgi:hypothetical protein